MSVRVNANGDYLGRTDKPGLNFTTMGWFRFNSLPSGGVIITVSSGNGGLVYTVRLDASAHLEIFKHSSNGDFSQAGTTTLSTGVWYHIALATSGNVVYLDGVQECAVVDGNTGTGGTTFTRIGSNGTTHSDVDIAYVKQWSASLTADEVANEVNIIHPVRLSNLWHFTPIFPGTTERLTDWSFSNRPWTANGTLDDVTDAPPVTYDQRVIGAVELEVPLAAVGEDLAFAWHIRTPVFDTVVSDWRVRQAVGEEHALSWHDRAHAQDSASLDWHTRQITGSIPYNGDFEAGSILPWNPNTTETLEIVNEGHTGTHSLGVTAGSSLWRAYNPIVRDLSAGELYETRVWVKAGNAGAVGRLCTLLQFLVGGAEPPAVAIGETFPTAVLTTEWQELVTRGVIDEDDRTELQIYVGTTGTFAVGDQFLVDTVTTRQPQESITSWHDRLRVGNVQHNGHFEGGVIAPWDLNGDVALTIANEGHNSEHSLRVELLSGSTFRTANYTAVSNPVIGVRYASRVFVKADNVDAIGVVCPYAFYFVGGSQPDAFSPNAFNGFVTLTSEWQEVQAWAYPDFADRTFAQLYLGPVSAGLTVGAAFLADNFEIQRTLEQLSLWSIRQLVGENQVVDWHTRSIIGDNQSIDWHIRTAIGKVQSIAWHILNLIGESQSFDWHDRMIVGNIPINGHFETGSTAPWSVEGDSTIAISSDAFNGVGAMSITTGSNTSFSRVLHAFVASPVQGDWYTASIRVKAGNAGAEGHTFELQLFEFGGTNNHSNIVTATVTDEWQELTVSAPIRENDSLFLYLYFGFHATGSPVSDPGDQLLVDAITVVEHIQQQSTWNVHSTVNDTVLSEWHIRTAVGEAQALAWHVLAELTVGEDQSFVWHTRSLVTKDRISSWHVHTPIGEDQPTSWHIRHAIGESQVTAWNVAALVNDIVDLAWHVLAAVNDEQVSDWHVCTTIDDLLVNAWHVRTLVGESQTFDWSIHEAIDDLLVAAWLVHQAVGEEQSFEWNIESFTAVAKLLAVAWHVQLSIGEDQAIAWLTQQLAGDDVRIDWHVRESMADLLTVDWNTRSHTTDTIETAWNLRALAGNDVILQWDVLSGVTVGELQTFLWHIRSRIGDSQSFEWHVVGYELTVGGLYVIRILDDGRRIVDLIASADRLLRVIDNGRRTAKETSDSDRLLRSLDDGRRMLEVIDG